MKRWPSILPFVVLALGSAAGSAIGVIELRRAVYRTQNLYRLDTVGSQIESDLEFQTQESRRAFLYALAVNDPNEQLPYIDAARVADREVRQTMGRFLRLGAPAEIAHPIEDFNTAWGRYTRARDTVMADILTGNSVDAMKVDEHQGNEAFAAALQHLRALKRSLEAHAKAQSAQVHQTLMNCIVGLTLFVLAMFCIVLALLRLNRSRTAALHTLGSTNQALERAQEMGRRRVAILEMVGAHAPLTEILSAIVELPAWCHSGAGAAVWSAAGDKLLYQVSADLPNQVTNALRSQAFDRVEGRLILSAASRQEIEGLAARNGCTAAIIPLNNVVGDTIGLLLLFLPAGAALPPLCDSTQLAQLASLAIENLLLYERLAFQAQHDVLTGLPNRLLFQDRVQQAILRAHRNHRKVAVLWFDLDRFKRD